MKYTAKQTTCGNLPNLQIPSTLPGVPNLNPSQAIIDFLNDILSVLSGISEGDLVIAEGVSKVRNKVKVKIITSKK